VHKKTRADNAINGPVVVRKKKI